MKKVFFFEFWNCTPHIETAFELAKLHLDAGDEVHFYFGGHDLLCSEGIQVALQNVLVRLFLRQLPERHAAQLLSCSRFYFYPHMNLLDTGWCSPRNVWSVETLKGYTVSGYEAGLAVLSSLVSAARSDNPDFTAWHPAITAMIASGVQVFETVKARLQQASPDLVYVFNGRFYACRAVMNAAQAAGVPCLIHERGADKTRYYLKPYMPHDILNMQRDIRDTWTKAPRAEAYRVGEQYFTDRRQGKDQAWIAFTKEQRAGVLPDIDPSKRIIAYYSSSDDEYIAVGDIHKWEHWPGQFEAVMDLISFCESLKGSQLVIRMHPNKKQMSQAYLQKWYDLSRFECVTVLPPISDVDSYELLMAADLVVTSGSTIGIEAVFWGKPSICLGPSLYGGLGAVYEPKGSGELADLLASNALVADRVKTLSYGYYMSTFGVPFIHYQPENLFRGKFLGVDLQRPKPFVRRMEKRYKKVRRLIEKLRRRLKGAL